MTTWMCCSRADKRPVEVVTLAKVCDTPNTDVAWVRNALPHPISVEADRYFIVVLLRKS